MQIYMRNKSRGNKPHLLLVNPWVYDFALFDLYLKPLGLLYLSSHLKKIGIKVTLLDCMNRLDDYFLEKKILYNKRYGTGKFYSEVIEKPKILEFVPKQYKRYGIPYEVVRERLLEFKEKNKFDAILVTSIMTYWYYGVIDMIKLLKEIFPEVPVILGGIYANLMPEHSQKYSRADYVVLGNNINRIIKEIAKIINFELNDFDTLYRNFKEWEPPDFSFYKHLSYMVLLTSIGCPFRCTYCSTPIFYPIYQFKEHKEILKIIDEYKTKVKDFAFYDDALLFNFENNIKQVLMEVIKRGYKINFHTPNGLHIKFITREVADILYKAGFKTIRLSFETANKDRQIATGNKVRTDDLKRGITNLRDAGFTNREIEVYILVGFPDQKKSEVIDSIKVVKDFGGYPKIVEYAPIPKTPDYKRYASDKLDPLLHNNSIFFAKFGNFGWDDMLYFRQIVMD